MKSVLLLLLFAFTLPTFSQSYVVRDIKSFGAKGNGRTNDHDAFVKASAFFNQRGGNGKLILSKGVYLVGKQVFHKNKTDKQVYEGQDLFSLKNIRNVTVEGKDDVQIKYIDSLRYGAFDPQTGLAFQHGANYFVNQSYVASVGMAIKLENCIDVRLSGFNLNGNNQANILGGVYGDAGIQISYSGIYVRDCRKVYIEKVRANYFGQDGIMIGNSKESQNMPDEIELKNSWFEYNARQGFSWTGGNGLVATGCHFNHSGKSKYSSPPGAGVDVEAEVGPISNGRFDHCEFVDNRGCAFVADSGPSSDCVLNDCTFWGVTNWSIWITKPNFTVRNSKIYGSIVHGFDAATEQEATKYINCLFEDKPYKGQEPYGKFLIESNFKRRVHFEKCTMIAHEKRLFWLEASGDLKPEERYQIMNCKLVYDGDNLPQGEFIVLIRGVTYKNNTFQLTNPNAKKKAYYFNTYPENYNSDLGGNKFIVQGKQL